MTVRGKTRFVFIGEPCDFPFEKLLGRRRRAKYRLRGFRAVRTNLGGAGLTNSDLATLANERLDLVASASAGQNGSAGRFEYANLIPPDGKNPAKWEISKFSDLGRINVNLEQEINSIEQSLRHAFLKNGGKENREGVILVGFSTKFRYLAEKSLEELNSLALSAEKIVLDKMVQIRKNVDPVTWSAEENSGRSFFTPNTLGPTPSFLTRNLPLPRQTLSGKSQVLI